MRKIEGLILKVLGRLLVGQKLSDQVIDIVVLLQLVLALQVLKHFVKFFLVLCLHSSFLHEGLEPDNTLQVFSSEVLEETIF